MELWQRNFYSEILIEGGCSAVPTVNQCEGLGSGRTSRREKGQDLRQENEKIFLRITKFETKSK